MSFILEGESHQGKGSTGKSMGGGPRPVLDAREYPDVAVLDTVLCELRGAVGHRCDTNRKDICSWRLSKTHLDYLTANQKRRDH